MAGIAAWIAALAFLCTFLLVAVFGVRALRRVFHRRGLGKRIAEVEAILREHQTNQFTQVERLLFQLGSIQHHTAIETALGAALKDSKDEERQRLRKVFDSLGLTLRYVEQIRGARRWTERAHAAWCSGALGVVEAIPNLVACMRDPDEDAHTVKRAAAQALSTIRATEAIPILLAELDTHDDWASPRVAEVVSSFGVAAVPALIALLTGSQANSPNSRMWGAQILGSIGAESAVECLLGQLRDRAEQVRISVCEALGRLKAKTAVHDLMNLALRDPVGPVRAEAARALAEIGGAEAVETLTLLLADPDYWARLRAIEALEVIRPEDNSGLESALRDASSEVSRRAAVALERTGHLNRQVAALVAPDRTNAARARDLLVKIGKTGLVESLCAHLESKDFRVRAKVADVLGEVGNPIAASALEPLLNDPMWPVRVRVVEAIGRIAPRRATRMLLASLVDPEDTVRAAAVEAIRNQSRPEPDELEPILEAFDSDNAMVRRTVVDAVGLMPGNAVDDLLRRASADPNPKVRKSAVRAIGMSRIDTWLDLVVAHLQDSDIEVRIAAAESLGHAGSAAALKEVIGCLDTHDTRLREALTEVLARFGVYAIETLATDTVNLQRTLAVIWALGKTADPEAIEILQLYAKDTRQEVRSACAGALAKLGGDGSRAVLSKFLGDRDERTRAAAVNALGMVGDDSSVESLRPLLKDPDPFVRTRTAIALGRLGSAQSEQALNHALQATPGADEFSIFLLIALGLLGSQINVERVLGALRDEETQSRIYRVLARESQSVRDQFRRNLAIVTKSGNEVLSNDELVAQYVSQLRSEQNPERRATAIRALRVFGLLEHLNVIVDAVHTDPAEEVRAEALAALAPHANERDVRECVLRSLNDPNLVVQVAAARALENLADSEMNEVLLQCFLRGDKTLAQCAVRCLVTANKDNVTEFIDALMGHSEASILEGGALVLGEIGDPRAQGLLKSWLLSNNRGLKRPALAALSRLATRESRDAIMDCLSDTDDEIRESAVKVLAMFDTVDMAVLDRLVLDPASRVRIALAEQLTTRPLTWSINTVQKLVSDPNERVRVEALVALALRTEIEAIAVVERLVAQQSESVKHILARLSADSPLIQELRNRATNDRRLHIRLAALRLLRTFGNHPLEFWVAMLSDPEPDLRLLVVQAVVKLKDPQIEVALQLVTSDPDPRVRAAARERHFTLRRS